VLFIGNEYDMHVEHETVCYDNISIYILRSGTRPLLSTKSNNMNCFFLTKKAQRRNYSDQL